MRRLAVVALALALLPGCGGSGSDKPDDPGLATLGAFLHAASESNPTLMRGLLTLPSSGRLGDPALERLAARLRPLARSYTVLVSERISDDFGVTAVIGRTGVYAAALRLEGEEWRLELGGPVRIIPLGPDPGSRDPLVQQLAAEVKGGSGGGNALVYLDGLVVPQAKVFTGTTAFTVIANLPSRVTPGRHSLVVFAERGRNASALAWTFSVAPKG